MVGGDRLVAVMVGGDRLMAVMFDGNRLTAVVTAVVAGGVGGAARALTKRVKLAMEGPLV